MAQARQRNRNEVGGPAVEPVTLTQVKTQLRITSSDHDDLLNRLIVAATDYTENLLQRALVERTVDYYLDAFPGSDFTPLYMPFPPLISITSIKYYDDTDTLQTWSSGEYVVDTDQAYRGLVYPGRNYSWPSPRVFRKSVAVEYQAGYQDSGASPVDDADNVPQEIKDAILLLIGHWFENPEASSVQDIKTVPLGYEALLVNFKVRAG